MLVNETKVCNRSIVVEELTGLLPNQFHQTRLSTALASHEFLPYDTCDELHFGFGFFAKIDECEVARVGMSMRNSHVFVGGLADALASEDFNVRLALLRAVEDKSKLLGFRSVSLYTTGFALRSISFYKKLGYYFSGKKRFVDGTALLHMEKVLNE